MTKTASAPKQGRRRRGLFDFVLLVCLAYAVYARTPIGAVIETGVRVARGQKDHPSWLQTFRGRDATTTSTAQTTQALDDLGDFARRGVPARLRAAAATHDVDVDTLAALVAVRGRCDESVCTATAPDRLTMYVPGAVGEVDVDVLAQGLKAAKAALATDDAALLVEALFLGTPSLKLALAQAERSGLEATADVEVHAPFLSPGARRGPLQGALAVLLVHRLRTLAWPADPHFRVTSPFGDRLHPVTGKASFHNGTDIGTPTGTPLGAAHDGVVRRQGVDSVSGTYVILDHGLGVETTYCHLNAARVREKERIRRRQTIAESGSSGRVTGPHLHYILRIAAKAVDPERYGEAPNADGALVAPSSLPAPSTGTPSPPSSPASSSTGTTPAGRGPLPAPKTPKASIAKPPSALPDGVEAPRHAGGAKPGATPQATKNAEKRSTKVPGAPATPSSGPGQ
jgi:murein DD-endopeptidase